ncbi:MAG: saccharopine dehydrogenase NADP-binding domain-containing protein [Candidatus Thermoplasmatota archaeon]|jgi:saccharopine dehydrogenase-like NADP-dependent oxidoreductase|nr:saccharopine dehydrogenase NADP-binding domain-containing protein [Candidatus Thermoplasmatota archaeon]MCL5790169.1 saccharopine dehydrogenase NADP-binding domain-containing protein [Candidatus Thermoplasmatota archaeon]
MKKVILFGLGLMGFTIAHEIGLRWDVDELIVVDNSKLNLKKIDELAKRIRASKRKVKITKVEEDIVLDKEHLTELARGCRIGIGSLPHSVSPQALEICLNAGINYIDLVYDQHLKKFKTIDEAARKRKITVITSMGVAPGLSNAMVAHGIRQLDSVDSVIIYVGGVPDRRAEPLDYKIVFSATSVVNEYIRDARVKRNGKMLYLPPMSEVERVNFVSFKGGDFEAFLTDGLSTLIDSFPDIPNMEEKTVRWTGHVDRINFLRNLGMFSNEEIQVKRSCTVKPSEVLSAVMNRSLKLGEGDRDITLMKVEVKGMKGGKRLTVVQELYDRHDDDGNVTSMARTTGYTCVIVAKMLYDGVISKSGFLPPERALDEALFKRVVQELTRRKIVINEFTVKGDIVNPRE